MVGRIGGMGRMKIAGPLMAVLALGLAACSPQPAAEATPAAAAEERHPTSNLRIVPVTVRSGSETRLFRTEVANSPEAQARGLMFRTELPDDEAMLFPRDEIAIASFWMKNTPIPLDIIFIGTDLKIINIAAMTTPYSLDPVLSDGPVGAVLEIRGGLAEELGIEPGDTVQW